MSHVCRKTCDTHGRRIFETSPARDDDGRTDLAAFDVLAAEGLFVLSGWA